MRPTLVTLYARGNDILDLKTDMAVLMHGYENDPAQGLGTAVEAQPAGAGAAPAALDSRLGPAAVRPETARHHLR
jgi:hypothetical protein